MCKPHPYVTVSNHQVCDAVPKDRPKPSAFHQGTCNSVLLSSDISDHHRIVLDQIVIGRRFLRLVNRALATSIQER